MRVVIQRVSEAAVSIDGQCRGSIGRGLLVDVAVAPDDTDHDIAWLTAKIARLRIFADDGGRMNLNVVDIDGEILVISQFTLFASTRKGTRPGFTGSAAPTIAVPRYERFLTGLEALAGRRGEGGEVGWATAVSSGNVGPVTIVIDSKDRE
jgi:D-tyrosyl-tRNA(Tyr) deacylase